MLKNVVDVITMGCSKNLVDSERLMRQFAENGYICRHEPDKIGGEIVVINTCGFIESAKEESVNTILSIIEAKKKKKIKKIFVMGCLSERYRDELKKELPEVDRFYGKFDWNKIVDEIGLNYFKKLDSQRYVSTKNFAYLKISEGCNRTCSYCAIPIITGKHCSRPIEEIVAEAQTLADMGIKEINLIAQDLTYYGLDIYKKSKIAELVDKIAQNPKLEWIRLHYGYPSNFPLDLLPVLRENKNVCNYLDMAFQHISDNMLTKMRRKISKAQTLDLISKIREEVPGIHLRTTLLVGHPFESEKDFEELVDFVASSKFERLGAFAYSHEEDTYSFKNYKDEVPQRVKNERVGIIMEEQEKISDQINSSKIGQVLKVAVDREEDDYYVGRTEFDSPEVDNEVLISKSKKLKNGNFYNVEITASEPFDLYGKVVV